MTHIKALVVGLTCFAMVGCATTTAEMLAKPGGSFGPASGADFGLVRYQADGSASDIEARQQDAKMKMYDACSGRYRVLAQGARNQINLGPGFGRFGRGASASSESYVYIKFVCTR
ncbi:MAG TPA: hypothetical protein VFX04_08665 [Rhodanobacteraceae bacterium]|jgi:hypothetical protein|nr:hypothetical protein [Rhodanobacteraceae bacterium]